MEETSNAKKDRLLGMPHGTANAKLRKSIIFQMAGMLNLLSCFRCQKMIEDIDHFSIEHKVSWQLASDPKRSFFDLQNISFSHLRCNVGAATQVNKKYFTEQERLDAHRRSVTNSKNRFGPEARRQKRHDDYLKYGH